MPQYHEVEQGECLTRIALRYRFRDYHTIWDHPRNADLKTLRKNPNVLMPGDTLYIPDPQLKEASRATDQSHQFKVSQPTRHIRLVIKDHNDRCCGGAKWTLACLDPVTHTEWKKAGTAPPDGVIEADIPLKADTAVLCLLDFNIRSTLAVANLDPIYQDAARTPSKANITGIQARLNNLGFGCGEADGALGPMTRAALSRFQRAKLGYSDEDAAGDLDNKTCDALLEHHGC
jgi:N-acetylmuramoyl-L-alanine amidase